MLPAVLVTAFKLKNILFRRQ